MVKLNELIRKRTLSFWSFVKHLPEDDEKKEHIHLRFVPNGQVDTDKIGDYLLEHDPTHPEKPLGCTIMKHSKFDDWYLYAIHDVDYLASKGQARKYHYAPEEVVSSDEDALLEEVHQIDRSKLSKVRVVREAVEQGVSFQSLVKTGQVPVQQIFAFEKAYNVLSGTDTYRNGRTTHQRIDPETGEILDL